MKILPTPDGYPFVDQRVALGGATYTIHWSWNERDGAWYFGLDDPNGRALVASVRVVLNVDLLASAVADPDLRPPYPIVTYDPTGSGVEPTREDLGTRVKVLYLEPSR